MRELFFKEFEGFMMQHREWWWSLNRYRIHVIEEGKNPFNTQLIFLPDFFNANKYFFFSFTQDGWFDVKLLYDSYVFCVTVVSFCRFWIERATTCRIRVGGRGDSNIENIYGYLFWLNMATYKKMREKALKLHRLIFQQTEQLFFFSRGQNLSCMKKLSRSLFFYHFGSVFLSSLLRI